MDKIKVNSKIKEKNLYYTTNAWDAILLDETGGVIATAVALSESSVALATEMIKKRAVRPILHYFQFHLAKS